MNTTYQDLPIEVVEMIGNDIPDTMLYLTHGRGASVMWEWMMDERHKMYALAVRLDGKFIAWAAVLQDGPKDFSIGTYVAKNSRNMGLGTFIMSKVLDVVKSEFPDAKIWYGGCTPAQFFYTYTREIQARFAA